jgi:hypothetical protein
MTDVVAASMHIIFNRQQMNNNLENEELVRTTNYHRCHDKIEIIVGQNLLFI